jgi:Zn finger protein HypA/HybF involved in hydrogenase expression
MVEVPERIICHECGGSAYLLVRLGPEDEVLTGDIVAYRCPDCAERLDVVIDEPDDGATD